MRNLELQEDNVQPSAPLADYSSDNSLQSSARSDGQCRVPSAPMLMPSAPPTAESCTTSREGIKMWYFLWEGDQVG